MFVPVHGTGVDDRRNPGAHHYANGTARCTPRALCMSRHEVDPQVDPQRVWAIRTGLSYHLSQQQLAA